MGNQCVRESDSLINEATHDQLKHKLAHPGIYALDQSNKEIREQISFESSINSPYPITYRENMDVIGFQGKKFALLENNSVYYGEINESYQKHGKGKLYYREIDRDGNQKLVISKGIFKYGKLSKSDIFTPEKNCSDDTSESRNTESPESSIAVFKQQKYNQIISDMDLNSIMDQNQLRQKIIDGYIQYLQQLDEKKYWETPPEKREQFQRTILFQSNSIDGKAKTLKKQIKQYSSVKFWLIYQKIGFVIQHNSDHWYFLEVKITEEDFKIIVYDSIQCPKAFYDKIKSQVKAVFEKLMNQSLDVTLDVRKDIPQSYNLYDSGVYTCIFARMLRCNCKNKNFSISVLQMRKDLQQLFS